MYVAAVVGIVSRHRLTIDSRRESQSNNPCNVALYKSSVHCLKRLYVSHKMECFSYKGGCGVTLIEAFKRRATFGYI